MTRSHLRTAAAALTILLPALTAVTACGGNSGSGTANTTPASPATESFAGTTPSAMLSAAASAKASASAAASSAASRAASFEQSVSAQVEQNRKEATDALAKVSGRGNAVGDVQLTGVPLAQTGGLHAVVVRITNRSGSTASYAVRIDFKDQAGGVVDSTVVGAKDVGAGKEAQPVAFSTKDSSVTLTAVVAQAQRY